MNIKQSIFTLFFILGVSFSASTFANTLITPTHSTNLDVPCLSFGVTGTWRYWNNVCVGTTFKNGSKTLTIVSVYGYNGQFEICWNNTTGCAGTVFYRTDSSCPSGQEYDADTGKCEVIVPFCDLDSTLDQIFQAEQACSAQGGIFSHECFNGNEISDPSLTTSCTQPNECVIGYPNWPACLDDLDPTNPLDRPNIDGIPNPNPDSITPSTPSFDKDTADEVTPESGTDKSVLQAVQNLNRDSNAAFSAINKDLNSGVASINTSLSGVIETQKSLGIIAANQLKQDYDIYQETKTLLIGQTAATTSMGSSITGAVNANTAKLDELSGKLSNITPCDPSTDPRSCEGQHGMDSGFIQDVNDQINYVVDNSFDTAQGEIIEAAQGYVDDAGVSSIQVHISDVTNSLFDVFPNINDCTAFSLPSPFGGSIHFDCEFSIKFKTVASWLLYIYTLWSLLDILLNDITPVAPAMTKRYYH